MADHGGDMNKVISEGLVKIIIGEQQVSYLDTMIGQLKQMGLEDICKQLSNNLMLFQI